MGAVWWVGNTFPMPGIQQDSDGLNTIQPTIIMQQQYRQARPPTLNCFVKVL